LTPRPRKKNAVVNNFLQQNEDLPSNKKKKREEYEIKRPIKKPAWGETRTRKRGGASELRIPERLRPIRPYRGKNHGKGKLATQVCYGAKMNDGRRNCAKVGKSIRFERGKGKKEYGPISKHKTIGRVEEW